MKKTLLIVGGVAVVATIALVVSNKNEKQRPIQAQPISSKTTKVISVEKPLPEINQIIDPESPQRPPFVLRRWKSGHNLIEDILPINENNNVEVGNKLVVNLIPQIDATSCWAASLEMVMKANGLLDSTQFNLINNQPFNINLKEPNCKYPLGCKKSQTMLDKSFKDLTQSYLKNYKMSDTSAMDLVDVRHLLTTQLKPVLYNFGYSGNTGDNSHICVMSGFEEQRFESNNNISFIKITDPWPPINKDDSCKGGNEYYMTYERYKNQLLIRKSKYTIFPAIENKTAKPILLDSTNYLKTIISRDTPKKLSTLFLENITKQNNKLSDEFFRIITLPRDSLIKIKSGLVFKIASISRGSIIGVGDSSLSWNMIVNWKKFDEHLVCLVNKKNKDTCSIQSILIASNITPKITPSKWIVNLIEKGEQMNKFVKNKYNSRQLLEDDPNALILFVPEYDAYFIMYEYDLNKPTSGKIYDLYGNGFSQLYPSSTAKVKSFNDFYNSVQGIK